MTNPDSVVAEFHFKFMIPDGKTLNVEEMLDDIAPAITHPPEAEVYEDEVHLWLKGEGLDKDEATALANDCFNDHLQEKIAENDSGNDN